MIRPLRLRHRCVFTMLGLLLPIGLGLGIATPGLVVASANASDPQDFGVSTGMRTTITQVGVTAGIQSMTIALGTSYTPSAFAGSFWLGCTVAAAATGALPSTRDRSARTAAASPTATA